MIISITHLKLKSVWKLFPMMGLSMRIFNELKVNEECQHYSARNSLFDHYTLTAWKNEEDLRNFVNGFSHKKAMKRTAELAAEVNTVTLRMDEVPNWTEAKRLLKSKK